VRSRSEGGASLPTGVLGGTGGEEGARGVGCGTDYPECNRVAGEGVPLPCQDSHNSITPPADRDLSGEFSASAKRTAFALQTNVEAMCREHGIERVGFLTLTFADHVTDPKEAQRRMNSLTTNVLRPRYGRCIRVIERQKSGRIHYHLLVAVRADIRTGCDFDAFSRKDYRSAPPALRSEWAFWRATAKEYGFGRTELLPVRSTSEAIGCYVGKYIGKHIHKRELRDRRIRLVSYTGGKAASTRFAWVSPGATQWRKKLAAFVTMLHDAGAITRPTAEAMAARFGPRWAHYWRDQIMTFPLPGESDVGPRRIVKGAGISDTDGYRDA
jgi:hypothetical protein